MSRITKLSGKKSSELLPYLMRQERKAVAIASKLTGYPASLIRSRARPFPVSFARQLAYHLTKRLTGFGTPMVGLAFGRDHKAIQHGLKSVAATREMDPRLRLVIEQAEALAFETAT